MSVPPRIWTGSFRSTSLLGVIAIAFVLLGAYEAAQFIVAGDTAGLAYAGLSFLLCAFVVAMLNSWRRGLYIFLIWLLFEDFARKYLGNNMAIYFAKDFLVAVVYISLFINWRRNQIGGFKP